MYNIYLYVHIYAFLFISPLIYLPIHPSTHLSIPVSLLACWVFPRLSIEIKSQELVACREEVLFAKSASEHEKQKAEESPSPSGGETKCLLKGEGERQIISGSVLGCAISFCFALFCLGCGGHSLTPVCWGGHLQKTFPNRWHLNELGYYWFIPVLPPWKVWFFLATQWGTSSGLPDKRQAFLLVEGVRLLWVCYLCANIWTTCKQGEMVAQGAWSCKDGPLELTWF